MFVLPFEIPKSQLRISLQDTIFSIGSCFADNIGEKLAGNKFDVVINPLGTIYNPYSIFQNIQNLLSDGLDPKRCIKYADIYYHWDTHSAISDTDRDSFTQRLDELSKALKVKISTSKWLIITLGTAKVYSHLAKNEIVANCHKVPSQEFSQRFLSPAEIVKQYHETLSELRSVNAEVKVILSVSPVRHVRDGLAQNNYSKGILLQAVREIVEQDKKASYFPAYELMIDVLRDYRFYQQDMIHPTPQAVDFIWERFMETYIDEETRGFIHQWTKVRKSMAHRPFHPSSPAHQTFLKSTAKQLEALASKVDVSSEIAELEKQIIK